MKMRKNGRMVESRLQINRLFDVTLTSI